jgi:acetyl esterase/lipase
VDEARRFVRALRATSAAPVFYAELPRTQHAFDVLVSVRPAHAISGIVRFLEGVRSGRVSARPDIGPQETLGTGVRPDVPSHPG